MSIQKFKKMFVSTTILGSFQSKMATPTNMKVQLHSFGHVIAKLFPDDTADFEFQFNVYGNELKILRAHKKLLSMMSPVFEAMFSDKWNTRDRIIIDDVSYAAFKEFLQVFYKNEVEITEQNVGELLHLADKYNIEELVPSCQTFLIDHLTMDNCINSMNFATVYDIVELKKKCEELISENTAAILGTETFQQCTTESLTEILKIQQMQSTEKELFDFCIVWAKKQCEQNGFDASDGRKLREILNSCFDLIRFAEMKQDEYIECVEAFDDMFEKKQIFSIFKMFNGENVVVNGRQKKNS